MNNEKRKEWIFSNVLKIEGEISGRGCLLMLDFPSINTAPNFKAVFLVQGHINMFSVEYRE